MKMPFLHYETDEGRRQMRNAITKCRDPEMKGRLPDYASRDQVLFNAYLTQAQPLLQPRRTLDQFFYTESTRRSETLTRSCKDTAELIALTPRSLWSTNYGFGC